MRKPVLVLCAAASMVLTGAGLLTATTTARPDAAGPLVADLPGHDSPAAGSPGADPRDVGPPRDPAGPGTGTPSSGVAGRAGRTGPAAAGSPSGTSVVAPAHSAVWPGRRSAPRAEPVRRKAVTRPARPVTPGGGSRAVVVPAEVLPLVNESRRRAGCPALAADDRLAAAARGHAADMARRGYFAHTSPEGAGVGERITAAGYRWARSGENIARGQRDAAEVMRSWLNSPPHRANILDCRFTATGIGAAAGGDGGPYWVQVFAAPA